MNKVIFSFCVVLILSISVFFGISYNVYSEKENSSFILPESFFENKFIQDIILITIPTASAFLTSLYVTNTWQIRKEKLELQRKILDEVDNSIVNSIQTLKNFDRMLWSKYTIVNTSIETKETTEETKETKLYETKFPSEKSEYPNPKFEKEHNIFLTKYADETLELWKFSSTIKLYYEKKLFDDFDKIVISLDPTRNELEKLYNSKNKMEFDLFHKQFMTKRKTIESQIIKFKEDLVKGKIKKLNV
ncbi:MAG: hypothetical protein K8Q89_09550 [Nitrosarchaeum sp.]|nr:hypothetical protein [Nitrosarchaeum sp.]